MNDFSATESATMTGVKSEDTGAVASVQLPGGGQLGYGFFPSRLVHGDAVGEEEEEDGGREQLRE